MKNLIVAIVMVGFISLGFTVVNNTPENKAVDTSAKAGKIDFSDNLDEKRLACWD